MVNFITLKKALYDWVVANSLTNSVIWANQNGVTPNKPHVTLFLSTFIKVGRDSQLPVDDVSGDAVIKGDRELTLSIQHFGDQALENLDQIRSSLDKPTVLEGLSVNSIAVVDDTLSIIDLSTIFNNAFEPRASIDILFRISSNYGSTSTDNVNVIENIDIQSEYKDVEDNTITNNNINI